MRFDHTLAEVLEMARAGTLPEGHTVEVGPDQFEVWVPDPTGHFEEPLLWFDAHGAPEVLLRQLLAGIGFNLGSKETATKREPGQLFFFGAWPGGVGHYLRDSSGARVSDRIAVDLGTARGGSRGVYPWSPQRGAPYQTRDQQQGRFVYWSGGGYSLLTCWDRSGDHRTPSCSAFLCTGTVSREDLLARARDTYPAIFSRLEATGIVVGWEGELPDGPGSNEVFFFGVWPAPPGHYLRDQFGGTVRAQAVEVEAQRQRGLWWAYPWDFFDTRPQPHGIFVYWCGCGLSLLTCWDRSGDHRRGSVATFICAGALDREALEAAARLAYPAIFARIDNHKEESG